MSEKSLISFPIEVPIELVDANVKEFAKIVKEMTTLYVKIMIAVIHLMKDVIRLVRVMLLVGYQINLIDLLLAWEKKNKCKLMNLLKTL